MAGLYLPEPWPVWGLVGLSGLALAMEATRAAVPWANERLLRFVPLFKPEERARLTGATFLVLAATLAFALFSKEVAVLCLIFVSVGDPVAALAGFRSRRGRLFGKSIAGTVAFGAAALAAASLAALHPDVGWAWWIVVGAMVAAVGEMLPLRLDDNLSVPLAAGGVMTLLA